MTNKERSIFMQHLCEIIRCINVVEQGPCWSQASLLKRGDTAGAYEICYYCQRNAWKLQLRCSLFLF